jgi:hypothetical protein
MKQSALDHQTAILFPKEKQIQISILASCKKNKQILDRLS